MSELLEISVKCPYCGEEERDYLDYIDHNIVVCLTCGNDFDI